MSERETANTPGGATMYFGGQAPAGENLVPVPGWGDAGSTTDGGSATDAVKQAAGQVQEKAAAAVETAKQSVGQVAGQATEKVDAGMDKAAGGLDKLADTIRDKGESMGGDGGGGKMQAAATTAADKLDLASHYLRDKDTNQIMTDLETLVRQKPGPTLAVAAGVGFLLAKVLR